MPLKTGEDNEGCFIKYGDRGHKYYYTCGNAKSREIAKKKAIKQAVAIGEFISEKISMDYDDTLTKPEMKVKAKNYIKKGVPVYIISARHSDSGMESTANELGIPMSRVFATGSNNAKVSKIKSLGITKHFDNNKDVIDKLGDIGVLVSLSMSERYKDLIDFIKKKR